MKCPLLAALRTVIVVSERGVRGWCHCAELHKVPSIGCYENHDRCSFIVLYCMKCPLLVARRTITGVTERGVRGRCHGAVLHEEPSISGFENHKCFLSEGCLRVESDMALSRGRVAPYTQDVDIPGDIMF